MVSDPIPKSPIFSNVWYDRMKFLAQIVLPGLGALYYTIATIWGLPEADKVLATVTGVVAFLGLLLQISSNRFAKGGGVYDAEIVTAEGPQGPVYAFQFGTREEQRQVNKKDVLTVKVNNTS